MFKLDSLAFLLMSELTTALIVVIAAYLLWLQRRKRQEREAVQSFIARFNGSDRERQEELKQHLVGISTVNEETMSLVVSEIRLQEKALYRQVTQTLLLRDIAELTTLGNRVKAIMVPFYTLLEISKKHHDSLKHELEELQQRSLLQGEHLRQLRQETDQLTEQLGTALQTLDEVSNEYSRIFGETKGADELEMSRKKTLNVLRQAEMRIKQALAERLSATESLETKA